ncbi:MAG: TlpA disulfide reductase family protein [Pseudomonadota bacterium]
MSGGSGNGKNNGMIRSALTAVLLVTAITGGYLARSHLSGGAADAPANASNAMAASEAAAAAETAAEAAGLTAGAKPVEEGRLRPAMTLNDHTGQPRSLAEWDGDLVLVNFWATWCAPCRREIPMLTALQTEFGDSGFQVVGIAIDEAAPVSEYMKEVGINYPVLVGEQEAIDAAEAYGAAVTALPLTAIVDRAGQVAHVYLGELHREQALEMLNGLEPGFSKGAQR